MAAALIERSELSRGDFQVEVRPGGQVIDPLSGRSRRGRRVAALWARERLLAVLLGEVLAVSRFGRHRDLCLVAAKRAEDQGLSVVFVSEASLWPLLGPPRPR